METVFIEATHGPQGFNHGKFMVGRFTPDEWARRSVVDGRMLAGTGGWTPEHVLVLDLQTGEGAIFRPGGKASYDLGHKHQIWVCLLYEAFLEWLYQQDLTDLQKLPALVELPDAPAGLHGYRRDRGGEAGKMLLLSDVLTGLAAAVGLRGWKGCTRGQLEWLLVDQYDSVRRLAESAGLQVDFTLRPPRSELSPTLDWAVSAAIGRRVWARDGEHLNTCIGAEDAPEFLSRCPGPLWLWQRLAASLSTHMPPVPG